jgi:hypothetical protein
MKNYFLKFLIISSFISCNLKREPQLNLTNKTNSTDYKKEISTEPETFSDEDGRFEIKFPGTPTKTTQMVTTEIGKLEMIMFAYEKSLTEAFMLSYNDYPSKFIEASNIDSLLLNAREGAMQKIGIYTYDKDEKISKNGYHGLYTKGYGNNYYIYYHIYMVGNRMYQIMALKDGSYTNETLAADFLNSFNFVVPKNLKTND